MVSISVSYEGGLHCSAVHGPSGKILLTDAPLDNQGNGAEFSPTDLVATALGTCIATTMAIVARRRGYELPPLGMQIVKEMSEAPPRRIQRLSLKIQVPMPGDHSDRSMLERAAHNCPVSLSLHADLIKDISFIWNPASVDQGEIEKLETLKDA